MNQLSPRACSTLSTEKPISRTCDREGIEEIISEVSFLLLLLASFCDEFVAFNSRLVVLVVWVVFLFNNIFSDKESADI